MDAPDSTNHSNLLISCSILPNQSINLQIKSRPSLKGKTHFLNENKQKVSRFLNARKWSPYCKGYACTCACMYVSTSGKRLYQCQHRSKIVHNGNKIDDLF